MEIQEREVPFHFKSWKRYKTFLDGNGTGSRPLKISNTVLRPRSEEVGLLNQGKLKHSPTCENRK